MIDYLRGTVVQRALDRCVLEVRGIGYRVYLTPAAADRLPGADREVILHIHHHIRDGEQTLYGFMDPGEREVFERLIGISGIGPRMAMAVLGGLDPVEIQAAVLTGDSAAICAVKGVGKKTAERIVLELRDKLDVDLPGVMAGFPATSPSGAHSDVLAALVALGFSRKDAFQVLGHVLEENPSAEAETLLRSCVSRLGGGGQP